MQRIVTLGRTAAHQARDLPLLDARLEWFHVAVDEVLHRDDRVDVLTVVLLTVFLRGAFHAVTG